ncbi:MAG: hypothetical protein ACSHYF_10840 [Verrucomicrobiaceae bacterium]
MKLTYTLSALLATAVTANAANILSPGDFIIAIGEFGSNSNHPGGEPPEAVLDGDSSTKYLNFAKENSGFIVTPGSSTAESIVFTTAGDAEERDPASFSIWGTNDAITSTDNGTGLAESWTPILTNSAVTLPSARQTVGTPVNLSNGLSFSSYRVSFDTLKNSGAANSMQIADVQLFDGANGSGSSILGVSNSILAFHVGNTSNYPGPENPSAALDGDPNTKYLNFGGDNTGLIVTPGVGSSIADGFSILTANDEPGRDPLNYILYGTNDSISSTDNSDGSLENWAVIQSGTLTPPNDRFTEYGTAITGNSTAYSSYRFDVTGTNGAGIMQFAEFQITGQIPEPSTGMLALLALAPLMSRRR